MDFKRLDDHAKDALKVYLKGTGYRGSDYSYYAFLCWFDDLEYAEDNGALYLRAFFNGALRYWRPLLGEGVSLSGALSRLPKYSTLCFVTEPDMNALRDRYVPCTNRDWSEYVYRASDFIGLEGKRYKVKRNHISKFLSLYKPEMSPYTEADKADFEAFEKIWFSEHSSMDEASLASAEKESRIVREWLSASLRGETVCDVLRVDGKLIGISIGEIMGSGNAVVMYEKADIDYDGVYSYLAHEFAARNLSSCEFINRQEDMGLAGLRKSKLSYYPELILDKYVLTPIELCKNDEGKLIKPCEGDSSLSINNSAAEASGRVDVQPISANGAEKNGSGELGAAEAKAEEIRRAPLDAYEFRKLNEDDFNAVMTFLKCGISKLENKLFFLNYTDAELSEVLISGYMLGAFYDNHLVATCALDKDKEFGNKLAALCNDIRGRQYYEFSGIMVCPFHRGKGLANLICKRVIDHAKETVGGSTLCATVQFDNVASLNNLFKLGFKESGNADYKEYSFKYLTLDI